MSDTERQLTVNITTTNTWTQLLEGNGGAVYAVPSGSRAILAALWAGNIDTDSVTVEFAISINSTIDDAERILLPKTLLTNEEYEAAPVGRRDALLSAEGVWGRAVGTTPNVTFRATIMEVVP